jgi:tRNA_anti-like
MFAKTHHTWFFLMCGYLIGAGLFPALASQPPSPEDPRKEEAIRASVADVQAAYWFNEVAADEKIAGKRVRVSGQMERLKRLVNRPPPAKTDAYALILKSSQQQPLMFIPIVFEFDLGARKRLAAVTTHEILTLEGTCAGRKEKPTGEEYILFTDSKLIEEPQK